VHLTSTRSVEFRLMPAKPAVMAGFVLPPYLQLALLRPPIMPLSRLLLALLLSLPAPWPPTTGNLA
jgi:hypothetical protein